MDFISDACAFMIYWACLHKQEDAQRVVASAGALLIKAMRYHQGTRGMVNVMIIEDAEIRIIGLLDQQLKAFLIRLQLGTLLEVCDLWCRQVWRVGCVVESYCKNIS